MTALISWGARNFVDSATITILSGGEETAFPVANVKKRGLADVFTSKVQSPTETLEILIDNSAVAYRKHDDTFTPNVNGNVNALAVQSDGRILLGGDYSTVSGVTRTYLARVLPDGRLDESFAATLDGEVNAIAVRSDGKIVIGGAFATVNGTAQAYIARLRPDGTLDTGFAPSLDTQVMAIVLQSDGKIVIGGAFTTVNGDTRAYFARLLSSGATDTGFSADANNTVYALAIDSAGKIVVGGAFTSIGGSTRNRIARVTSAGAVESFDPNANNTVFAIAPKSDGTLYVGGSFTSIGGATRNRIARLLSTGSADTGWNPGGVAYGADDTVYALVTLPDGGVFVGGAQNSIGDETSRVVGRISTSGAVSSGYTFINDTGTARALAITGGSVIVGGYISDHGNILKVRTQAPGVARVLALVGVGISEAQYGESISVHARNTADESWTLLHTWSLGTETLGGRSLPPMMVAAVPDGIAESAQFRITTDAAKEYPLTIARVWVGDAVVLDDGIDSGWTMGFADSGSIDATAGQQWVESAGVRTRVLTIPLEGGRDTETVWGFSEDGIADGRPSLHALQFEAGTTGEVLAVARMATASWIRHSAVYGHIDQPWAIGHKAGTYWGSTIKVVEER